MTEVWEEVKEILDDEEEVMMIDTTSTNMRGVDFKIVYEKKKRNL